jgi:N-acetylneuraminate synthase/pseudaminic acid synthase
MEVKIGKYTLGLGHPTFIVAEMSGNHNGNLDRAIEIVHSAKRAGANAIKLQTYKADTITLNCDKDDFLLPTESPWRDFTTLWDLYNEAHTPWEWHEKIIYEAKKLDLEVFSSPFDETSVDFLESLDVSAYKIASPEITHIPLLKKVALTGKPVIVSTGVAELADIELALDTLRDSGVRDIILLKCTSSYPAPPEESNLNTITDMLSRFDVLSGLSDHTMGTATAIASVALGGSFIEKHFNLDDEKETVDSFFSSGEQEFSRMVQDVRLVEKSLGKQSYEITKSALPSLRGRRSLYVSAPIKAGELFTGLNIKSVRPSFGLHPKYYHDVIGRFAKCDLEMGDRLSWDVVK